MLKFSTQKHLGLLAQRFSAAEMTCCTKFNGSSQRRRPKRPRALYAGPNFLMSWWTGPLGTRPCLFQEIAQQKSELGVMIKDQSHRSTGDNLACPDWLQQNHVSLASERVYRAYTTLRGGFVLQWPLSRLTWYQASTCTGQQDLVVGISGPDLVVAGAGVSERVWTMFVPGTPAHSLMQ